MDYIYSVPPDGHQKIKIFIKDPDSKLWYVIDYSRLFGSGDTIASSSWLVPEELTLHEDSFTPTAARVFLSGGTLGKMHTVTNRITTSGGRILDTSIKLKIEEL